MWKWSYVMPGLTNYTEIDAVVAKNCGENGPNRESKDIEEFMAYHSIGMTSLSFLISYVQAGEISLEEINRFLQDLRSPPPTQAPEEKYQKIIEGLKNGEITELDILEFVKNPRKWREFETYNVFIGKLSIKDLVYHSFYDRQEFSSIPDYQFLDEAKHGIKKVYLVPFNHIGHTSKTRTSMISYLDSLGLKLANMRTSLTLVKDYSWLALQYNLICLGTLMGETEKDHYMHIETIPNARYSRLERCLKPEQFNEDTHFGASNMVVPAVAK